MPIEALEYASAAGSVGLATIEASSFEEGFSVSLIICAVRICFVSLDSGCFLVSPAANLSTSFGFTNAAPGGLGGLGVETAATLGIDGKLKPTLAPGNNPLTTLPSLILNESVPDAKPTLLNKLFVARVRKLFKLRVIKAF